MERESKLKSRQNKLGDKVRASSTKESFPGAFQIQISFSNSNFFCASSPLLITERMGGKERRICW